MYVGGAFVRSESGRYFRVASAEGVVGDADPAGVNIPRGSRKDVRDAVLVAKGAYEKWEARTPFNRGQILYRLAEVLESRAPELEGSLMRAGATAREAAREVAATVDRAVFYAGFADKVSALVASHNPVSGPHFGFSLPEAMGVVGVLAPRTPALLGLVSVILPVITGGNSCVVVASDVDPRTAVVLTECLATSDLPGGVVNVLTGYADELGPILAKHREVVALDVWSSDAALRASLERDAASSVKRVKTRELPDEAFWYDTRRGQGLGYIERTLETKTVWHPVGGLSGAARPVVHDESGHASSTLTRSRPLRVSPRTLRGETWPSRAET
ncbi:MAG: aldehyde dehydrogenase family protein [Myxococcales bacterium]|nr:aldehyde dehydrogenase family protein [Myxococcales bacterium]